MQVFKRSRCGIEEPLHFSTAQSDKAIALPNRFDALCNSQNAQRVGKFDDGRHDCAIVVTDLLPAQLTFVAASGAGWTCGAVGQTVTCTHAADLAVGDTATITLETIASGEEGDTITNVVIVESQGVVVETIVDNNDDEASLVIGVLPATGRNLGTFAWFGLLMLLGGVFLVLAAQRKADQLWIEQGVRL